MNEKFDKFTERARRVLSFAQEEAQRCNHNYIGTEHLLLGLIREEEGIGARALVASGVELNKARSAVEVIIGRGDRAILGDIGLTPRAKKVVELAVDEARRLGHHYIGTEHLLLGLIREGEGIAAHVLESMGVTLDRLRATVLELLVARGGASSAGTATTRAQAAWLTATLTLFCRDVDATLAFYVDILGATEVPHTRLEAVKLAEGERFARLPFGGAQPDGMLLALRASSPEEAATPATGGPGSIALSFIARDITALYATIEARGAADLSAITEVPGAPNQRVFTLTDPDGRTLRFQGVVQM